MARQSGRVSEQRAVADKAQNRFSRFDPFRLVPVIVLVAIVVILTIRQPAFIEIDSLQGLAIQAAPVLLLAAGLTPVVLLGALDLSVAALASLCSVMLGVMVPVFGIFGVLLVILIAAGFGALVGWVQAVAQVPSFIVTLGAMGLYAGLALWISGATNQPLGESRATLDWLNYFIAGVPVSLLVALAAAVLIGVALKFGTIGRYIFAIGSAEPAAIMSGTSPMLVRVWAFALSGTCAALASCALVAQTGFASPTLAQGLLVPVIAAVLVGGTSISGGVGSMWRTVVGALIVIVLQSGLVVVGLDPVVADLVFGLAIIVALTFTTDRRKSQVVK